MKHLLSRGAYKMHFSIIYWTTALIDFARIKIQNRQLIRSQVWRLNCQTMYQRLLKRSLQTSACLRLLLELKSYSDIILLQSIWHLMQAILREEVQIKAQTFTAEQLETYRQSIASCTKKKRYIFFIDDFGGTGNTYRIFFVSQCGGRTHYDGTRLI